MERTKHGTAMHRFQHHQHHFSVSKTQFTVFGRYTQVMFSPVLWHKFVMVCKVEVSGMCLSQCLVLLMFLAMLRNFKLSLTTLCLLSDKNNDMSAVQLMKSNCLSTLLYACEI